MVKRYYRVVDDSQRDDGSPDQTTLKRWLRTEFSSTHESPPPRWLNVWAEGKRQWKFVDRSIPGLGCFSVLNLVLGWISPFAARALTMASV